MTPRARARMMSIVIVVLGLGLAAGFALYGLSGKITYFHTPTELAAGTVENLDRTIRIGGMVKNGSLKQDGDSYTFTVTDTQSDLDVAYRGVLPDLFREGQGVVANGRYDPQAKLFTATQILAKHDENYMPPDVKKMMEGVEMKTNAD